jgi:hypothetical protein
MKQAERERAFDTVLDSLANSYRRQLLVALLSHSSQADDNCDPLNIVTTEAEPDVLLVELVHRHLPKLADRGYIAWDRTTNEISKGPNWNEIAPLLELIHEHQDSLPEGWL